MKTNKKRKRIIWGVVIVLLMAIGATAAFAQGGFPGRDRRPQTPDGAVRPDFNNNPRDRGHDNEALADALGITVEELETALETARAAALEQVIADGLITQEQADQIGEHDGRLPHPPGFGDNIDFEALLADALGVSVEELQAAHEAIRAAQLEQAIADGRITQEQADMMAARQAVNEYIDHEALQQMMRDAYETAVQQAVDNGDITQEQADALLEDGLMGGQRPTMPNRFPSRGGHDRGGFPSHPGGFDNMNPRGQFPPAPPPTGTSG